MLPVPISAYLGLILVIFAMSFVLFTVASFILFGISQAIRKRAIQIKGFVRENFKRVALFSLLNALSSVGLIAWQLKDFVPKDLGGALVGPLLIIVVTLGLTTAFWIIAMAAELVWRARNN